MKKKLTEAQVEARAFELMTRYGGQVAQRRRELLARGEDLRDWVAMISDDGREYAPQRRDAACATLRKAGAPRDVTDGLAERPALVRLDVLVAFDGYVVPVWIGNDPDPDAKTLMRMQTDGGDAARITPLARIEVEPEAAAELGPQVLDFVARVAGQVADAIDAGAADGAPCVVVVAPDCPLYARLARGVATVTKAKAPRATEPFCVVVGLPYVVEMLRAAFNFDPAAPHPADHLAAQVQAPGAVPVVHLIAQGAQITVGQLVRDADRAVTTTAAPRDPFLN